MNYIMDFSSLCVTSVSIDLIDELKIINFIDNNVHTF